MVNMNHLVSTCVLSKNLDFSVRFILIMQIYLRRALTKNHDRTSRQVWSSSMRELNMYTNRQGTQII